MTELELSIACPRCDVAAGTRCTSMSCSGYRALERSHAERVQAYLKGSGMSRKAYDDLQRMRQGLLVWGRELPSRWSGHGEDYAYEARYVVHRSNDTSLWTAFAPGGGSPLVTSARTAAVAKEACQEHYTRSRQSAGATDVTGDGSR